MIQFLVDMIELSLVNPLYTVPWVNQTLHISMHVSQEKDFDS